MDKILTVNDVAAILQVKAITVREMFREKRLRGFKVGKSWRTTEVMLKEDIDALSRGESPATLPSPENPALSGAASQPSAVSTPGPSTGPSAGSAPKPAPRKKPAPVSKEKESGDDETQQLLF